MQVKSIAKCLEEHSAILSIFIKLPCVIKIFVLSIFSGGFTQALLLLLFLSLCIQCFSVKWWFGNAAWSEITTYIIFEESLNERKA